MIAIAAVALLVLLAVDSLAVELRRQFLLLMQRRCVEKYLR